uniref:Uncharacterized protein n=1 Tax=Mus musculus TaxID=10090 RepID=Q4KMM7_MOUSE|nr:RIKEN cDNA 4933427D06 gene [Mus musculus]
MAEGPSPSQLLSEMPDQDSDERPGEQGDPCVEQQDPVEVDEPKESGQPARPIAYVRSQRSEPTEPTEPAGAAGRHAGRGNDEEQRAYPGRQRRRWRQRQRQRQWAETGSHSQAAFQEWQEPSEELVLQTYFSHSEETGAAMNLYPTLTPVVPVPAGMAQWPPIVYGYWAAMATYPYVTFIPVANIVPCFMSFRAPMFLAYIPW